MIQRRKINKKNISHAIYLDHAVQKFFSKNPRIISIISNYYYSHEISIPRPDSNNTWNIKLTEPWNIRLRIVDSSIIFFHKPIFPRRWFQPAVSFERYQFDIVPAYSPRGWLRSGFRTIPLSPPMFPRDTPLSQLIHSHPYRTTPGWSNNNSSFHGNDSRSTREDRMHGICSLELNQEKQIVRNTIYERIEEKIRATIHTHTHTHAHAHSPTHIHTYTHNYHFSSQYCEGGNISRIPLWTIIAIASPWFRGKASIASSSAVSA